MILVKNIRELYCMLPSATHPLGLINDAAVLIENGTIFWLGPLADLPKNISFSQSIDANKAIVVPGFIDCHTHLIFAADRCHEFYLRSWGKSYGEILQAGGGIVSTMQAVRASSIDELILLARPRLQRMLERGVCTIEAKSGYGLSTVDEIKMLEALKRLNSEGPVSIEATFLGAHALPPEYGGKRDFYVDVLVNEMLPAVKAHGFARFCDVFVEEGAFSVADGRRILSAAQKYDLLPRVHAEQLTHQGAAALACEVGALSASHLEHINADDIELLAKNKVVAEVLPIAQEYLGMKKLAPARELCDAGVAVAVATDFNPGSAMCDDLLLAARLAVTRCALTCEEALQAITINAAKALGRDNIGHLSVGSKADLCFLDCASVWHLLYDWSINPVSMVIKDGALKFQRHS